MLQWNLFNMNMDKANLRMYIVSDSFKMLQLQTYLL